MAAHPVEFSALASKAARDSALAMLIQPSKGLTPEVHTEFALELAKIEFGIQTDTRLHADFEPELKKAVAAAVEPYHDNPTFTEAHFTPPQALLDAALSKHAALPVDKRQHRVKLDVYAHMLKTFIPDAKTQKRLVELERRDFAAWSQMKKAVEKPGRGDAHQRHEKARDDIALERDNLLLDHLVTIPEVHTFQNTVLSTYGRIERQLGLRKV